jgi:hypothetical protein
MSSNDCNNGDNGSENSSRSSKNVSSNGSISGKDMISLLLKELEEIVTNARKDRIFRKDMKEVLQECGNYRFDNDGVSEDLNNEEVMKIFAVAVNEAIQKKVDLTNENTEEVDKEPCQLPLGTKRRVSDSPFSSRKTRSKISKKRSYSLR